MVITAKIRLCTVGLALFHVPNRYGIKGQTNGRNDRSRHNGWEELAILEEET